MTMARAVLALWAVLLAAHLVGAKTDILAKAVIGVAAACVVFYRGSRKDLLKRILKTLETNVKAWHVITFIALTFLAQILALVLDYEALNGTLWDLAMYIQITYSQATTGLQQFTFPGTLPIQSHFLIHRSLSIYVLGFLYKLTQSPWVLLIWQGFWLFAPGLIALLWYRSVTRARKQSTTPLGYLLAFLCWAASPCVLRMEVWPYAFYMMAFTLLALAYLFYSQKRWLLWFVTLLALAYEKEDFGVVSTTFGVMVALETLVFLVRDQKEKAQVRNLLPLGLGLLVAYLGVHSFTSFHAEHASVVTFASRFSEFGETPGEAVRTFFTKPKIVWRELTRPDTLKYLWYFFATSLLWLVPKWRAIRFAVPVVAVLGANALASYTTMQNLKDPYALPIMVGAAATVVLGVFATALDSEKRERAYLLLLIGALLPYFWGHQSPFRTLKDRLTLFKSRTAERALLDPLRADKETVICCEDRLCAYLADRPYFVEADRCARNFPIMNRLGGRQAVYVTYTSSKNHYDVRWAHETPMIRVSEPVTLQGKSRR